MDYQLVVLIGMLLAVVVVAIKNDMWAFPRAGRPGYEYQRVIAAGVFGLLLFVSGLVGWDLSHSRGWFQGTKWVEGPVWWQVGLGSGLLLLAGFWFRRVPPHRTRG